MILCYSTQLGQLLISLRTEIYIVGVGLWVAQGPPLQIPAKDIGEQCDVDRDGHGDVCDVGVADLDVSIPITTIRPTCLYALHFWGLVMAS